MESKVYQKPIVILEDDEGLAFLITEKIKEIYLPVISFQTASKAIDWLENNRNQAKFMMIDFSLPDMNAIGFLNCLKEKNIPIPRFVVVTGYGGEQIAVELMKLGAEDYFVKNSQFLESIPKIIKTQLKSI
ncbi:MAG TPA: response regulator, partial [bacterium]|nr:response regulator [bacterium]